MLVNYFQDQQMSVKWHDWRSAARQIRGGGPQWATLGILEYLSKSNDCVNVRDRFTFVDELTVLKVVNLLTGDFLLQHQRTSPQ